MRWLKGEVSRGQDNGWDDPVYLDWVRRVTSSPKEGPSEGCWESEFLLSESDRLGSWWHRTGKGRVITFYWRASWSRKIYQDRHPLKTTFERHSSCNDNPDTPVLTYPSLTCWRREDDRRTSSAWCTPPRRRAERAWRRGHRRPRWRPCVAGWRGSDPGSGNSSPSYSESVTENEIKIMSTPPTCRGDYIVLTQKYTPFSLQKSPKNLSFGTQITLIF